MEKARLLVIDDNENLVDMIEEYFSDHEFIKVVLKAYSGEEGINLIENKINDYDVIILDLIMPNKDGIYVLEQMKRKNIYKPVIISTSYSGKLYSEIYLAFFSSGSSGSEFLTLSIHSSLISIGTRSGSGKYL